MTVKIPNFEPALSKIPGVSNVRVDGSGWIDFNFKGSIRDLDEVEREVRNQGVSAAFAEPVKLVLKPTQLVKDKGVLEQALKSVKGVQTVVEVEGYYHCLVDSKNCDPEALLAAANATGAKAVLSSHEVFHFQVDSKSGKAETGAVITSLLRMRYVVNVSCEGNDVRVVGTLGKVSKASIKVMLEKEGLIVVQ